MNNNILKEEISLKLNFPTSIKDNELDREALEILKIAYEKNYLGSFDLGGKSVYGFNIKNEGYSAYMAVVKENGKHDIILHSQNKEGVMMNTSKLEEIFKTEFIIKKFKSKEINTYIWDLFRMLENIA